MSSETLGRPPGEAAMALDAILPAGVKQATVAARALEPMGFDGLWTRERTTDPLVDLGGVAAVSQRATVGTAVAIAFGRAPFVLALQSWQLHDATDGRFVLGLGTQVKGHLKGRYGVEWASPGPRMREYIALVRHLWNVFQGDQVEEFAGDYYHFSILPAQFRPDPLPTLPRIYLAGVNPYNCRTAGMSADGIQVHPLHSPKYLTDSVLTHVRSGAADAGRDPATIDVMCPVMVVAAETEQQLERVDNSVRETLAFYGSTRTYKAVFEAHGWYGLAEELHEKMARGDVRGLRTAITDEIRDTFAVVADPDEVGTAIQQRYSGTATRVHIYNADELPWLNDPDRVQVLRDQLAGAVEPGVNDSQR